MALIKNSAALDKGLLFNASASSNQLVLQCPACFPVYCYGKRNYSLQARAEASPSTEQGCFLQRPGRRHVLSLGAMVACISLSQANPASFAAEVKKGFNFVLDKKDGYSFLYPFGWQEVVVQGEDKVFKDVIEPLESVSINMVPTSKQDVRELGSPQELLSRTLQQHGGMLGVAIANGGTRISHLLYADDVLFFSQATNAAARKIKAITGNYCRWTGQVINLAKSAILFSKTTRTTVANRISRYLGYRKVAELDYLGIKLATRTLRCNDFAGLIQKAKAKASAWGNRHLSLAGRATLIRTSLLPGLMYAATHTIIPKRIMEDIQKIGRQFLWQQHAGKAGLHYVAWSTLCQPLRSGGLGFHATERWKGPLRARLTWNLIQQPNSVLHNCLREKYGKRLWLNVLKRGDSPTWRVLRDGAESLQGSIKWRIGDGTQICVLNQCWLLDRTLNRWPTFLNIAGLENMQVADLLLENGEWNLARLQGLFGEELIKLITATKTWGEQEDNVELCKQFSGKTVTALTYHATFLDSDDRFIWIKKLKLQPRECFFWWRILRDAIPTNDWLYRRRLSETSQCPWGCDERECVVHVISKCSLLGNILSFLHNWGFPTPRFQNLNELTMAATKCTKQSSTAIRLYCYAVYQGWRARNARKHGRPYGTPAVIAAYILGTLSNNPVYPSLKQWDTTQPSRLFIPNCWCPPPPGWLKANVDGALTSSYQAGIVVVVRNDNGELIVAAGQSRLHWDSTQVELEAILFLESMMQPWMFELNGIIIEGDNTNVIDLLKSSMLGTFWKAYPPLSDRIAFLRRFHQTFKDEQNMEWSVPLEESPVVVLLE